MSAIRLGEFAAEAGWLVVIVLLLPVLIPLGLFAAVLVLQERLAGQTRRRRMRGRVITE